MQHLSRYMQATGRWSLALFLCLILGITLVSTPAFTLAQEQEPSPVRLQVSAGYDGAYRVSHWFPVHVTVSNDGPDIQGVLEWHFPGMRDNVSFKRVVDLPRGAQKRLVLNAFAKDFARTGDVRLVVDGTAIVEERVRLTPIEVEQYIVGVVSSDSALLSSLASMKFNNRTSTTVTHLSPDLLPEEALTLAGIDALFLHDIITTDLTSAQRAALELWVSLGGQLVVSGGANAERTVPGLTDLLPVTVEGLTADAALASLGNMVPRERETLPASATVSQVEMQPAARQVDNAGLLVTRRQGAGQVIFSRFDLSALRAWTGEPALWSRVLDSDMSFEPGTLYRWRDDNLVQEVVQFPGLRLPSFGILVLFILFYVVVIGPLNFLMLRRMRRSELAWITVPAIVLLFVGGTYAVGTLIRGNRPRVVQVAIVQGYENMSRAQATDFIGLFSPRRDTYTLTLPPNALVSQERLGWDNSAYAPIVWTEQNTELRDLLVDVSSLRTAIVEQVVDMPFQVSSNLQRQRGEVRGAVQNLGSEPLRDAVIVYGSTQQRLGTLAPGDNHEVVLERNRGNFPGFANFDDDETMFNRQRILNILDEPDQFGRFGPNTPMGGLDDNGVYLLSWGEQPLSSVQIDGTSANQDGLILYVIRLNG